MKIVIDRPEINFEIEDKNYTLSLSDEDVKRFYDSFNGVQSKLAKSDSMENINTSKELVINALDELLGKGESIEIYNNTGKSTFVMVQIFAQIVELIAEKADELKMDRFKKLVEKR